MLQSLVLQPPTNKSIPSSSMKNKRSIDAGESSGEHEDDPSFHKRRNFPGETTATVSGEKAADDQEEPVIMEAESNGLRLLGLLLQCAECVAVDNLDDASDLLPEISELSSPFGSSPERVAAYFAEALHARIISSCIGTYTPLTTIRDLNLTHSQKICNALQSYNSISPLIKFSHFTANQAIFQALDGKDCVHIIDLDIMQGLQWPGLFHILASRPRNPFELLGLGPPMGLDFPRVQISKRWNYSTGKRLTDFASSLGLPFEFHPFEGKVAGNLSTEILISQLAVRAGETMIVHWMHHCLYDVTGSDLGTLKLLTVLRPKLITIVAQDLCHGGSFLGRFVEALHYYSALFDALGDGLDGDSIERHTVEQQLFGCEIKNIVAVGGPKRTGEVNVERWGDELRKIGFQPVSLAGTPLRKLTACLGCFLGKVTPWWRKMGVLERLVIVNCLHLATIRFGHGWTRLNFLIN